MSTARKYVIKSLSSLVFFYIIYCVFFYIVQRRLLFPLDYISVPSGIAEQVPNTSRYWIENEFGKTETWYLPPINLDSNQNHPLMIVGHGNGDVIDSWINIVSALREKGIGILLVEFPGYARSDGVPNQKDITDVFVKSYDIIVAKPEIDKSRIILLGHSIGGGAICALAKQRPSSSMILISTFTNVGIFASQYYLPKFLIKDTFDNLSVVADYKNPLLLVHGKNDNLIPITESEKLKSVSPNGEFIILKGGHNMIKKWRPFWENRVIPFLEKNQIL